MTAWIGSGGTFTSLLSKADSTYSSGYAGIEGSGNNGRLTEFKAGPLGPPRTRKLHMGISANTRSWTEPGTEQDVAAETGVSWLREDIEWAGIEPTKGEWNWTATDRLIGEAAERGLTILPILDASPCWAVPSGTASEDCGRTFPESNADFGEFAAHATARYGPGGTFWKAHPGLSEAYALRYWEVWNEPYYGYFTNEDVDPAKYAALYKAAVVAGRAANSATRYLVESTNDASVSTEVSPTGFVNWPAAMVEAEPSIGNYIDGIAIHPYPGSHNPDYLPNNGTDASFKNTNIIYERWRELGVNKPIWITEVGYSSCNDGAERCVPGASQLAREARKAEWIGWLLDELGEERYGFVHAVFLYDLREWTNIEKPDSDYESWLGIVNGEGEHLFAWTAFSNAVAAWNGVPEANTKITAAESLKSGSEHKFTFSSSDPTSTLECKLDAGAWTTCTSPKSYTTTVTGHTFQARSTNDESTESSPAEYSW